MSNLKKNTEQIDKLNQRRRSNGEFGHKTTAEAAEVDLLVPRASRLAVNARGTMTGPGLKITPTSLSIGTEKPLLFPLGKAGPLKVAATIQRALETGETRDIEEHPVWLFAMPEEEDDEHLTLHVSTSRRQQRISLTNDEATQVADHLRSL